MFASISLANPNSTVTSSFKASEACVVDVDAGLTVRVNEQIQASRPINLAINDTIALDVMSPPGAGYKFVPWTYNGVQSYFAVVSKQDNNKPTLKGIYRGKMWYDYTTSVVPQWSYINGNGSPTAAATSGTSTGTQTTDLIVLMNPASREVHYIRSDNTRVYQLTVPVKPLAHARMFNGAVRAWESYFLGVDGFIYYYNLSKALTKSTVAIGNAKSLWSDSTNLYVGGVGFVKVLSDINTVATTITTTETIVYGVSAGGNVFVVAQSGKIYKIDGNTLTLLYNSTMVGSPTVYRNQVVFPIVEEYKLRAYNIDGTFSQDISCGDRMPWAVAADRDASMVVTYADNFRVGRYTSLTANPVDYIFPYNVTFAIPTGAAIFADHYLREFTVTAPPNPSVTGIAFPTWQAPIDTYVGSGEQVVVTPADNLQIVASPNATSFVNGVANAMVFNNDNRIALMVHSEEGRKSAALVMGNYAFDFKVAAQPSESFTTYLPVANALRQNQVIFNFTVPKYVKDAPIALSHGTLMLQNVLYNGQTPVQAGDLLKVTINVPTGVNTYSSILTIADSQFALTINTASSEAVDIQKYQDYLSTTTVSTFTVTETGSYILPAYRDAQVLRDGVVLTSPMLLTQGDVIEVHHVRMSSWWYDDRNTVLMGPTRNLVFKGVTAVDDAPDDFDLGSIHLAIPDFPGMPDGQGTIAGLSEDYTCEIFGDNMVISVNGADPVERPTVKNGDVIRVTQIVKNLFDDQYVKTILYDGSEYGFAVFHVDPALGVNFVPARQTFAQSTYWIEVDQVNERPTYTIDSLWQQDKHETTPASTAALIPSSVPILSLPLVSFKESSTNQLNTIMSLPGWETGSTQLSTDSATPQRYVGQTQVKAPQLKATMVQDTPLDFNNWEPELYERSVYSDVDMVENYIPSYGHEVIFRYFEAYWEPFQDITARSVEVFWDRSASATETLFSYGNIMLDRSSYMEKKLDSDGYVIPNYVKIDPSWLWDSPAPEWVNESSGLYAYMSWNHEEKVDFNPVFLSARKEHVYQATPHNDPSATPRYGKNTPVNVQTGLAMAASSVGHYADDKLWTTALPLKTGGYASETDAFAVAKIAAGKLEFTTYRQPEGTFSFLVKRETTLFCEIKTSDIVAGKWLLGGG